ncbi:hypothetical protein [Streptomyces sp. NPDC101145]|uniref:hypothetical protein n=1 Tax=Streptomyces sp. NPDC101145 TaxID=3366112 RepID=UPI003821E5EF
MTAYARHRHLRDAATICPTVYRDSSGKVWFRCELNAGHDGKHKDGCTWWASAAARPVEETR